MCLSVGIWPTRCATSAEWLVQADCLLRLTPPFDAGGHSRAYQRYAARGQTDHSASRKSTFTRAAVASRSRMASQRRGVVKCSSGALKAQEPGQAAPPTNWHRSHCQRNSGQRPAAWLPRAATPQPLGHTSDDYLHAGCQDSTLLAATAGCRVVAVALRPRRVPIIKPQRSGCRIHRLL